MPRETKDAEIARAWSQYHAAMSEYATIRETLTAERAARATTVRDRDFILDRANTYRDERDAALADVSALQRSCDYLASERDRLKRERDETVDCLISVQTRLEAIAGESLDEMRRRNV